MWSRWRDTQTSGCLPAWTRPPMSARRTSRQASGTGDTQHDSSSSYLVLWNYFTGYSCWMEVNRFTIKTCLCFLYKSQKIKNCSSFRTFYTDYWDFLCYICHINKYQCFIYVLTTIILYNILLTITHCCQSWLFIWLIRTYRRCDHKHCYVLLCYH